MKQQIAAKREALDKTSEQTKSFAFNHNICCHYILTRVVFLVPNDLLYLVHNYFVSMTSSSD